MKATKLAIVREAQLVQHWCAMPMTGVQVLAWTIICSVLCLISNAKNHAVTQIKYVENHSFMFIKLCKKRNALLLSKLIFQTKFIILSLM